ncbi:MAG: hypothetical protein GAK31_00660 [Stenotrophomonas maltophilia]|uniref:TetR family transcriptional regulator n=1 Tax=Stenotrophomonas maltophilia TaxID=40324 RepID=A0A7V8JNF0_STEMA|nr:MAG: hypothetical protein GAK31_00660 [Stenotrophomonas maltophilia]
MEDLRDAEGTRGTLAGRHVLALRQALSSRLQALGVRQPEQAARMVEAHWHGLVLQWGLGGTGSLCRWMAAGLADVLDLLGVEPE